MKAYTAFMKKEFCEAVRTYKVLIMGAVFLILGLMGPVSAKFLPEILDSFMPEGMNITLAEPTALDSWAQFFKNVPQMGLIVMVIVYSGIMSAELTKGTLINVLTKGLPRCTVILSKFTAAAAVWTGAFAVCFFVSFGYTAYFWNGSSVPNLFLSAFCLWLSGILLTAILLLGGVLLRSSYGSLLFTGGFVTVLFLLNLLPMIQDYNPAVLFSGNMAILANPYPLSGLIAPIVAAVILIVVSLAAAVVIFNKKQL